MLNFTYQPILNMYLAFLLLLIHPPHYSTPPYPSNAGNVDVPSMVPRISIIPTNTSASRLA